MKYTTLKTQSGSIYEVDEENKRMRRLFGKSSPSTRQGNDGEWKTYVSLSLVGFGPELSVFFDWDGEGHGTKTSPIVEYIDANGVSEVSPWVQKQMAS